MYTLILPYAARLSEFSTHLNGDCVETAMAVAMGIANGVNATPQSITTIVHDLQAAGVASSNGATTINAAHDYIAQQGYAILAYVPYSEPFAGDWLALLRDYAGIAPIVLNVANAQALTDVETGARDEAGVHYHACAVIGKTDTGYLCADGDNPQASERFQMYTRQTIEAAQPCGMVVIGLRTPASTPAPQGGTTMSTVQDLVAAGWHDDGTTLTAPNGHTLHEGFRGLILDAPSWDVTDQPLDDGYIDRVTPGASGQFTTYHSFHWDGAKCWAAPAGPELQATETTMATLQGQLDTANALTIALQTQATQLQAQVTQLQSAPVVTSDPDMEALAQLITKVVLKTEKSLVTHV